jgi:microsomal dipeptidase-like Zn-dependent dipeptidase
MQISHLIKRNVLAGVILSLTGCASLADRMLTGVTLEPPYEASAEAAKLHKSLIIIDLHADPLLWDRDLLSRNNRGHVDLPRLQEGNVALQVFGVVTGVPFPIGMEDNKDSGDIITLLASLQNWPEETYDSRLQRALYQARKLEDRVMASNGAMQMILNRHDLEDLLNKRLQGELVIGALLSLEGAHALEGQPENISILYDAGFRMLGLVHLFDNEMAGSTHGVEQHGLTENGRVMLKRALSLNMVIDLAHASSKTLDEVLEIIDRPVMASHGGVRGTCDTARNLSDPQIRRIAATGGVIGIGVYKYATCGKTMEDTVRAIQHVVNLVGIEYVALGSDFDGATTVVDATGLVLLTEALQKAGFTDNEIKAIMGENALRVFRKTLPAK